MKSPLALYEVADSSSYRDSDRVISYYCSKDPFISVSTFYNVCIMDRNMKMYGHGIVSMTEFVASYKRDFWENKPRKWFELFHVISMRRGSSYEKLL